MAVAVPRGTADERCGAAPSPCSARHDHHGSGSVPEARTDSPRMDVPHPRGLQFGHQGRAAPRARWRPRARPTGCPGASARGTSRPAGGAGRRRGRSPRRPVRRRSRPTAPRRGPGRPATAGRPGPASSATTSSRNSTRRAIGSTRVSVEVRARQAEGDAGQARAAAHVDDAGALRHRLGDGGAVEHVPLPQPGNLARADQPAGDPVGGQPGDVRGRHAGAAVRRPAAALAGGAGLPGPSSAPASLGSLTCRAGPRLDGSAPRPPTRCARRRPRR